jgi:hypothetical protein
MRFLTVFHLLFSLFLYCSLSWVLFFEAAQFDLVGGEADQSVLEKIYDD